MTNNPVSDNVMPLTADELSLHHAKTVVPESPIASSSPEHTASILSTLERNRLIARQYIEKIVACVYHELAKDHKRLDKSVTEQYEFTSFYRRREIIRVYETIEALRVKTQDTINASELDEAPLKQALIFKNHVNSHLNHLKKINYHRHDFTPLVKTILNGLALITGIGILYALATKQLMFSTKTKFQQNMTACQTKVNTVPLRVNL